MYLEMTLCDVSMHEVHLEIFHGLTHIISRVARVISCDFMCDASLDTACNVEECNIEEAARIPRGATFMT